MHIGFPSTETLLNDIKERNEAFLTFTLEGVKERLDNGEYETVFEGQNVVIHVSASIDEEHKAEALKELNKTYQHVLIYSDHITIIFKDGLSFIKEAR